jgi:hypothetical protein
VNMSNPVIHCYRNSRDEINGFQFNPDHLSGNPKIAGRLCEFLTDPPVTHVSLSCYTKRRKIQAILRVHGGIRIRDLVEIFGKMKPKGLQKGEYAYIATQDLDDEGNVIVKPVEPPAEDDSSDSGDESVSDDLIVGIVLNLMILMIPMSLIPELEESGCQIPGSQATVTGTISANTTMLEDRATLMIAARLATAVQTKTSKWKSRVRLRSWIRTNSST